MPEPERLVVGRVVRPHGVRGELSVEILSDAPERFAPGAELGVGDPDGPDPLGSATIRAARLHLAAVLTRGGGGPRGADRLRGPFCRSRPPRPAP